jgi:hypothetical protein
MALGRLSYCKKPQGPVMNITVSRRILDFSTAFGQAPLTSTGTGRRTGQRKSESI